jgi:hypothetical protein
MANTFGEQLVRFVQAVDYIDDRNFDQIRQLVNDYSNKTLNIQVTRLMVASGDRRRTVLQAYGLAKKRQYDPIDVKLDVEGTEIYGGQTAYAYDRQEPLWIVSASDEDEQELSKCKKYQNKWHPNRPLGDDFPAYKVTTGEPIRSSIMMPMNDDAGRVFGVFNFETTDRLQITDLAKQELKNLANALAIAYQTNLASNANQERSSTSLAALGKLLQSTLPKLTKPKIFLASSTRADREVIDAVNEVLAQDEFSKRFEFVYWKNMNNPGNINQQLIDELSSCRFGICYLSEKLEEGSGSAFQDNPNVVFEAGMLHGRSDADSPRPAAWIPIREGNSPTPPFDIASERMIIVPRDHDGDLLADELKRELIDRLGSLNKKR